MVCATSVWLILVISRVVSVVRPWLGHSPSDSRLLEQAKKTKQPIDIKGLEESAIKEFVQKWDEVKQTIAATTERLHPERDELTEEKNQVTAD